jgi:hypothetical protein
MRRQLGEIYVSRYYVMHNTYKKATARETFSARATLDTKPCFLEATVAGKTAWSILLTT